MTINGVLTAQEESETTQVGSEITIVGNKKLDDLTTDVFERILFLLDRRSIECVASTSQYLNGIVISLVSGNEQRVLCKCTNIVFRILEIQLKEGDILERSKKTTEALLRRISDWKVEDLSGLRERVSQIRETLVFMMKPLGREKALAANAYILSLPPDNVSGYVKHIVSLAEISTRKDQAVSEKDWATVLGISQDLAHYGYIGKAIAAAMAIDDNPTKNSALHFIAVKSICFGCFMRTKHALCNMTDDLEKSRTLNEISGILLSSDFIDEAIEFAKEIPCNGAWINRKKFPCDFEKFLAFDRILGALIFLGDEKRVVEFKKTIREQFKSDEVLEQISEKLISLFYNVANDLGYIDKAIEVVMMISDEEKRYRALGQISKDLICFKQVDKASEVVEKLPDGNNGKDIVLFEIAKFFRTPRDCDQAVEFAERISDERLRATALKNISEALIAFGNIDKAAKVAERISDPYIKSFAFEKILEAQERLALVDHVAIGLGGLT